MKRLFLSYMGNSLALPEGDSYVGRGLICRLRFNDRSVSRKHLRLTVDDEGTLVVEDLGSRNGTTLNGVELSSPQIAEDGDEIRIGTRKLTIVEDEDDALEEVTRPGDVSAIEQLLAGESTERVSQRCPDCGVEVSVFDDDCSGCGYTWAEFSPRASTKAVPVEEVLKKGQDRRRHPRHKIEVPVIYTSDNLAVESLALDLSRSGVFICTGILEPVGTNCSITILADGEPALTFGGRVCRVVELEQDDGSSTGLGIEFLAMNQAGQTWLNNAMDQAASSLLAQEEIDTAPKNPEVSQQQN